MPESAPSLRVRRLPGALTPDAVRALLEHFGAERVLSDRRPVSAASLSLLIP
jgi:hypothetical protein